MKKVASVASLAALPLVALLACNKPPEPLPEDKARSASTSTATGIASDMAPPAMPAVHPATNAPAPGTAANAAAGPEELTWEAPAAWVSSPNPSPMRKATYKIPKTGGDADDAELAVSAAAGGVEPNIKRWEQQFGDSKAKTDQRTINGLKVTVVEIKGKVAAGGMMGAPSTAAKDSQMLLGAIVDAGDRQHFFKMVGGEKTVTAAKKDFDKFVASFRAK
jgi:hypothetical protein